jgi:TRAP-type mannitol/chloroaromatic compound transport system permease small subunit
MIREVGVIVMVLIALGFIAASYYFMELSANKPIWDRLPYWAVSALFIIAAGLLVFIAIMLAAWDLMDNEWAPAFCDKDL